MLALLEVVCPAQLSASATLGLHFQHTTSRPRRCSKCCRRVRESGYAQGAPQRNRTLTVSQAPTNRTILTAISVLALLHPQPRLVLRHVLLRKVRLVQVLRSLQCAKDSHDDRQEQRKLGPEWQENNCAQKSASCSYLSLLTVANNHLRRPPQHPAHPGCFVGGTAARPLLGGYDRWLHPLLDIPLSASAQVPGQQLCGAATHKHPELLRLLARRDGKRIRTRTGDAQVLAHKELHDVSHLRDEEQ